MKASTTSLVKKAGIDVVAEDRNWVDRI